MKLGITSLFQVFIVCSLPKPTIFSTPSCSSRIYCQGKLLHVVQLLKPFKDSKHFVDMMMKHDEKVIHTNFNNLVKNTKNITKNDVKEFIKNNFVMEDELEIWHEDDFNENPEILDRITVPKYRRFAKDLMPIWIFLGRRIRRHILHKEFNSRYSIIPVPYGFVVPGGRFREFYYWDSYWIVVGLLNSDMVRTVKGMLENFLWLVDNYGFVPNGGRIYYLNRSQPPLLLMMVNEYFKVTKDTTWLKKNLPLMEKELKFWLEKKSVTFHVNNTRYTLARYNVGSSTPRPESYSEDYHTCSGLKQLSLREKCYRELKSGAESGWDFSSRWMTGRRTLSDMMVSSIIPVDLNAFLVESFHIISEFFGIVGDDNKKKRWASVHEAWRKDLHQLLYNEEDGIWYDFNKATLKQNKNFYPSNFAPLWVNMFPDRNISQPLGKKAIKYLIKHNVFMYDGGIPTSLYETGEQWDLPNAWPPLQSLIILGLHRSGDATAKHYARRLAERWIDVNQALFDNSMVMYEKYNSEFPGEAGSGGEYEVQSGFGWTNGVILELIGEFFVRKKGELRSSSRCNSAIQVNSIISILVFISRYKL
ncbi:trehalase-like [Coccinella septempunctata]|uniref:trehalase-like n=1 Tax=Coccinella septempunctata TaxID=41139 RepID=UPI001D06D53F|nr:trehalase-like [Coccinella septempunctata]